MRILFDPQVFNLGYSGMYRYYSVLYKGLLEAGIDIVSPTKSFLKREPGQQSFIQNFLHSKIQRLTNRFKFHQVKKSYFKALSQENYDLLYITAPNFETGFMKHLDGKPFVMTVHDTMESIKGYHTFLDQPRDTASLGYLAHQAERVVCVSNYTKNDLANKYLIDGDKIQTVHLANFLASATGKVSDLPGNYILFVGSRSGRKNFFEWSKAVTPYLSKNPNLSVVVTGELTKSELFFAKRSGIIENLISYQNVTDAQLNTLYKNAVCLVYPSLYEGFGLPILEAMANGCPVITSNCSSIPEVAGNAALMIDPRDPDQMLNSLINVHQNQQTRKELSEKGLEQSKKFSKEKFISEMIHVFEQAVQSSGT